MSVEEILSELESMGNPHNREGMARFGINTEKAFGVSVYKIRAMAKKLGKDHKLAEQLWATENHEARMLACFIDEPDKVTELQMDDWVAEFDSWDICDQVCSNLFDKTPFALKKIDEWTTDSREFVKRAGFVLIAALSVHDKNAEDSLFIGFLTVIERESHDERNFVKKAVNWALRSIGKRNKGLNRVALTSARKILEQDSKSAKWIARDAIRELESDKTRSRLK